MNDKLATVGSDKLGIYEPTDVETAVKIAKYLSSSDLVPKDFKGKEANCLIAMMWSKGLGIPYIQGMQNIAVINGKPSIYGDLMTALILNSGLCDELDQWIEGEGDKRVAHAKGKRTGMKKEVTKSFSVAEAKEAGLWGKDNWKKYPNDMLGWRAKSRLYRSLWADVLMGLGMVEETQDYTPPKGQPVDVTPDPSPVVDEAPQTTGADDSTIPSTDKKEAPEQGEAPPAEKPAIINIPSGVEDKADDDAGSEAEVVDVEHTDTPDTPGDEAPTSVATSVGGPPPAPEEVVEAMKRAVTNNRRYGWGITKVEKKWGKKMAAFATEELKALADIMRDCGGEKEKVALFLDTAPFATSGPATGSSETGEGSTSPDQTAPTPPSVPTPEDKLVPLDEGPTAPTAEASTGADAETDGNPAFGKEMVLAEIDNLIKTAKDKGVDIEAELGVPANWDKMKYDLEMSSLVDFKDDIKGYLG